LYATNYMETGILNAFRGITFAAPAQVYAALFLNNPTETGMAGTELMYEGYARQKIDFTTPAEEGNGIGVRNAAEIIFPAPGTDVGTASYIGIYDSAAGGNMLAYGQITEPLDIRANQPPVLLKQETLFWLEGNFSTAYKTKILNLFRGQNLEGFTPYFALFSGSPQAGGGELYGGSYARVSIPFSTPAELASGQMQIENSARVAFNRPMENWGSYGCSVIMNAATTGTPVLFQEIMPAQPVKKGYMPIIEAGAVKVAVN